MHRRAAFTFLVTFAWGVALSSATCAEAPVPPPDAIFSRAKDTWRQRREAPFVVFNLRERYTWRGRVHDNWWQAAYRERDQNLALHRLVVATEEEDRLKGAPISLDIHLHRGKAHADSFDTNPNADAFPVLDPLIAPNNSFGLIRHEPSAALFGVRPMVGAPQAPLSNAPSPTPAPSAAPASEVSPFATDKPLRELAHVEAVARDYKIDLSGVENVRGGDTYHLTLVPLRDPRSYRLRDLWIDTSTYATVQVAVQGLFEGKPYDEARWIVDYVSLNGLYYVQQIRTDEALRFGLDRVVTGLQYDFVQYDFPATVPNMTFEHFL